ncbi:MAG: hypothetical protein Q4F80_04975, partial [bacterium]|nr:hypothetical protein [bacterium]
GYQQVQPQYQQYDTSQNYNPSSVLFSSQPANTETSGQNLDITTNDLPTGTSESNLQELNNYYLTTKAGQGIFAKGIDAVKSVFSSNGTSKGVEEAIEKYENGQISYNEALNTIAKFEQKQKTSSDAAANLISGAASLFAGIAASNKGSSSAKSIAISALAGALSKGLTKLVERSTNGITGDALSVKDLTKDLTTGALNGAIVGGTANYTLSGGRTLTAATGSITGAISGGGIGYTNYMADVIAGDREFSLKDAAAQTAGYAMGGAAIGGVAGGIAGKISSKQPEYKINAPVSGGSKVDLSTRDACESVITSGNKGTDADKIKAIKEGINFETNEKVKSAYQAFLDNPNQATLKNVHHTASKIYHPDYNKGNEAAASACFHFYTELKNVATGLLESGALAA